MQKLNDVTQSFPPQQRKHRRFCMQYPVRVKVQSAEALVELEAVSRNISIGGLLLETTCMIPQHTSVSFILTVEGRQVVRPIRFVGEGKVVRVDPKAAEKVFAIAVECMRPITRIDDHLAAAGS